jgi:hypothetical protein
MANGQTSIVQGYGENQKYLRVGVPLELAQKIGLEVGDLVVWKEDKVRGDKVLSLKKIEV